MQLYNGRCCHSLSTIASSHDNHSAYKLSEWNILPNVDRLCVQTLIMRFSRMCMGSHWFQPLTGFGNQYNCILLLHVIIQSLWRAILRLPLMSLLLWHGLTLTTHASANYCTGYHSETTTLFTQGVTILYTQGATTLYRRRLQHRGLQHHIHRGHTNI